MSRVLLFSLAAALYPTLLAATTVMLLLPHPQRLLLGYLLGALTTSVTLGLVIVFALDGESPATSTAKHTINPVWDIVLGGLILILVFVVATGRDAWLQDRAARRRAASADKGPPKWKRALGRGSARTTFLIGALLTLPGVSYLSALTATARLDLSTVETVLTVLAINAIMLMLLEIPPHRLHAVAGAQRRDGRAPHRLAEPRRCQDRPRGRARPRPCPHRTGHRRAARLTARGAGAARRAPMSAWRPAAGERPESREARELRYAASALVLSASNSAWVIAPLSSSCLALSISAAAPPLPATDLT
jgi:hypothetical protein